MIHTQCATQNSTIQFALSSDLIINCVKYISPFYYHGYYDNNYGSKYNFYN